jgi:hypothetical protein
MNGQTAKPEDKKNPEGQELKESERLEDERPPDELNTGELKGVVGGAEVPISNVQTTIDSGGGLIPQQTLQQIITGTINAINQQNKRPT